jgi:hypothetical protein
VDTLLLVVTVFSLTAALVSALAVRKLRRTDRLRSDARVAALMHAADAAPTHSAVGGWNSIAGEMRWTPEPSATPVVIRESGLGIRSMRESQRIPNPEPRLPTYESGIPSPEARIPSPESPFPAENTTSGAFFGTVQREQPSSRRFAFAAALALVVALGGAVAVFTTTSDRAAAPRSSASAAMKASPLELVSLGHSRDASAIIINGVVRNPASGAKLEGLTAVVSLLDAQGTLISTKDVPLDYRALGPGEEAPFKILVPDSASIAKYRVSFRAGTDVVPHVDRRTDTKLASAL